MFYLYNVILFFLYILIRFLSLFNSELRILLDYRKSEKEKYFNFKIEQKCIWLHAASVGELDQCKALAKIIKSKEKDTFVLQTVFSNSVKENNYDLINTDLVLHLPLDFYGNYDWIFKKFKPSSLVIMAWDTWPNLIYAAKRFRCRLFLSSVVWDKDSRRNRFDFTKKLFSMFDGISPVSHSMVSNFKDFTQNKLRIISCGDSRFDFIIDKIESTKPNPEVIDKIKLLEYSRVLILASTYSSCEKIIFPVLQNILDLGYHVWIFPHKVNSERVAEIENELQFRNLEFEKFSSLTKQAKITLFDTLGILAYAYKYGRLAYIGGAMHNKIHNVLEPAYFNLHLITGKKIFNSFDAIELHRLGNLISIDSSESFLNAFRHFANEVKLSIDYISRGKGNSLKFYDTFLAERTDNIS